MWFDVAGGENIVMTTVQQEYVMTTYMSSHTS